MIQERRKLDEASLASKSDLLSIMMQDPLFKDNDESIINESISFFIAGTLT
jgi:hypothetical protein